MKPTRPKRASEGHSNRGQLLTDIPHYYLIHVDNSPFTTSMLFFFAVGQNLAYHMVPAHPIREPLIEVTGQRYVCAKRLRINMKPKLGGKKTRQGKKRKKKGKGKVSLG